MSTHSMNHMYSRTVKQHTGLHASRRYFHTEKSFLRWAPCLRHGLHQLQQPLWALWVTCKSPSLYLLPSHTTGSVCFKFKIHLYLFTVYDGTITFYHLHVLIAFVLSPNLTLYTFQISSNTDKVRHNMFSALTRL